MRNVEVFFQKLSFWLFWLSCNKNLRVLYPLSMRLFCKTWLRKMYHLPPHVEVSSKTGRKRYMHGIVYSVVNKASFHPPLQVVAHQIALFRSFNISFISLYHSILLLKNLGPMGTPGVPLKLYTVVPETLTHFTKLIEILKHSG